MPGNDGDRQIVASINLSPIEHVSDEPDKFTYTEHLDLEYEAKLARLNNYMDEAKQRRKYALRIFILTCIWVTSILGLVLLQGFSWKGFHLSDSVLLAAIGTTTANIIGVFLIVTRYFFSREPVPPVEIN